MSILVETYDAWLADDGPAALVIREHLMPVDGPDGVVFPATFAAAEDRNAFPGGYNIDKFPDGTNVCLIDSVGAQANRIELLFAKSPYAELVPQVKIKAGDKLINLLEAGHRAGDAIVRCSELQKDLHEAFQALLKGNAEKLAKIAPTSLVFGVWDSRDTQAKWPRLVASTIRAFNVRKLTRSAQYIPAIEYVATGLLEEPTDKKQKDSYAERGFIHVPASGTHGGVIATGGIRRDATLSLAALRLLAADSSQEKTKALQRYILGLALTAFTYHPCGYLRQGCNLVADPDKPRLFEEVYGDGRRKPATVTHEEGREVLFSKDLAKKDVRGDGAEGEKGSKKTKK